MDGSTPTLFVLAGVAVAALLVVLIVVGVRRERERQQRIRQWAADHGWIITKRPVVEWTARLPGRERRGVSLLMSGVLEGQQVSVAQYSYTTESMADSDGPRSTTTHHHHLAGRVPEWSLAGAWPRIWAADHETGVTRRV